MELDNSSKQTNALSDVLPDLERFASVVWGNPCAVLRQHEHEDFEYIDLAGYFDAFQFIFMGALTHDKVLVRNAYRVALEAMQTHYYTSSGAYITGQPGIGKTLFLVYALVCFLGKKQPVALQAHADLHVHFIDGTASVSTKRGRLWHRRLGEELDEDSVTWGLCGSSQYIRSPPSEFHGLRIIQTTSPKRSRWKEWSKQWGATSYVMDVWPDREIVHLAILLGLDVKRMCTLAGRWGNVPGTLMELLGEDDWTIDAMYRDGAVTAVDDCQDILVQGTSYDLPDGVGPLFFCLRPKNEDEPSDWILKMQVPTPTLRRFLGEALRQKDPFQRTKFFEALERWADTGGQSIMYGILFHMLRGVEHQSEFDSEDTFNEELQEMVIDEDAMGR